MPNLDLKFHCQWCNNSQVITKPCRQCGDMGERCRTPKWSSLKVAITNSTYPVWDVPPTSFASQTGCCGSLGKNYPAYNTVSPSGLGPFLQWGYWFHQRFRREQLFETWYQESQVNSVVREYYNAVKMWEYTTFRTGSASLLWYYWFWLRSFNIYVLPLRIDGGCKYRIFASIAGDHNMQQSVRRVVSDGRPLPSCGLLQTSDSFSAFVSGTFYFPVPCADWRDQHAPRCWTSSDPYYDGTPYAHTGIMSYYVEQPWEPPVASSVTSVRRTYWKDFDAIPSDPISILDFSTDAPPVGCSVPSSSGSLIPPTLSPAMVRVADATNSGPGDAGFPAGTLGDSARSICDPVSPAPTGVQWQEANGTLNGPWTEVTESIDGSNPPPTSLPTVDLGPWTIQFSM